MNLKYLLLILYLMVPLQAGNFLRKRDQQIDPSPFHYAWATQYEQEGNYNESFYHLLKVIRNGKTVTLEQNDLVITRTIKDLKIEFAIISLVRHFNHQLKHNNPNAYDASIYHQNGLQQLLELKEYYKNIFTEQYCLLSAVNLGNIARAEGKITKATVYYQYVISYQPMLSSLEQFSLFAIGYPLITDYPPIKTKSSSIQKLLHLRLIENDDYIEEFKRLYPERYADAFNEITTKTSPNNSLQRSE